MPAIDEFYVGFEFEMLIDEFIPYGTISKWKEIIFGDMSNKYFKLIFGEIIHKEDFNIDMKSFRVKYLDREDIESFGFKYTMTTDFEKIHDIETRFKYSTDISYFKNISIYNGIDEFIGHGYRILHHNKTKKLILRSGLTDGVGVFFGIIKNKSELKKLLKQFGI